MRQTYGLREEAIDYKLKTNTAIKYMVNMIIHFIEWINSNQILINFN